MAKVQIMESKKSEGTIGGFGVSAISKHSLTPLSTLHEQLGEHQTSHGTILNTVENMQANVEEFTDHIDACNRAFKDQIMEKVVTLKKGDTQLLTERVEELKGQEGTVL